MGQREGPFNLHKCNLCGYRTKFAHLILRHLEEAHRKNPKTISHCFEDLELYNCSKCPFVTHLNINLKNHIDLTHHNLQIDHNLAKLHRIHTCGNCKLQTHSVTVLAGHTCKKSKRIYEKATLKKKLHTTKQQHCQLISKYTPSDQQDEWFKCEHCTFKTKRHNSLERHYLKRHANWFQCDHCPFRSKYKRSLHNHIISKHVPAEQAKWYECDRCTYKTKIKGALKVHSVRMHDGVWFECQLCDYKGRDMPTLKTHQLYRHKNEEDVKWFKCERCGYKATEKRRLKEHVRVCSIMKLSGMNVISTLSRLSSSHCKEAYNVDNSNNYN